MLKVLNWLRFGVCLVIFAFIALIAREIHIRSAAQQQRKYDLSNVNHMRYNMFSVGIWKKKIAGIVVQEIQNFKVDAKNKEALKKHMEAQLDVLIDKVNEQIRDSNKDSTKGWIRQKMMDMLVDVEDIKKGIPNYADSIVQQVTDDKTQGELKVLMKTRLTNYLAKTFEKQDTSFTDEIVQRIGAKDLEEAKKRLAEDVPAETEYLFDLTWKLITLAVVLFLIGGYHRRKVPAPYFFVCWATLLTLLYVGVTTPMIDMDAKIVKFGFILFGYNIEFINQTVYFQTKSILDVFMIMIQHAEIEMRGVGVLLIMFSIIFPGFKLVASIFYYYNVFGWQNNGLMKAIVLKSGKWSMADVMVVAIAMAFIGFNGMVTTQMEIIKKTLQDLEFISTNDTTLQIGFYIFFTYVVLAIFFSWMISKISRSYVDIK